MPRPGKFEYSQEPKDPQHLTSSSNIKVVLNMLTSFLSQLPYEYTNVKSRKEYDHKVKYITPVSKVRSEPTSDYLEDQLCKEDNIEH